MSRQHGTLCIYTLFASFLIVHLFVSEGHATTLRKLSLDDLVTHADVIAVGTCQKMETVWLDKKIYTIATVGISQSLKGNAGAGGTIQVYILGGRVRKPIPVKMHVPGAAQVTLNEEMVLFLQKRGGTKPYYRFVGMRQGKVPVFTDPKTGEKQVCYGQRIKGVKMVDKAGKPLAPSPQAGRIKEGNLQGFTDGIRQMIADQAASAKPTATAPADTPILPADRNEASKEDGK